MNQLTRSKTCWYVGSASRETHKLCLRNCFKAIPLEKLNIYSNYFNVSLDYILQISNVKEYKIINKSIDPKIVGKRLLYTRHKFDITQEELAKDLNTTHSTISAYESGKTLILTSFVYEIAIKYKLSLDWLCGKID